MKISFLFRTIFTIVLISIVTCNIFSFSSKRLTSVYLEIAKNEAKNISSLLITETITEHVKEQGKMLIENEKISQYQVDIINGLICEVNDDLLMKLENLRTKRFEIPFSLVYSNPLLNSLGPSIPFKVALIGNVVTSSYYEVESFGVNNALITIFIVTNINMGTYLPLVSGNENIEMKIPISMNLIQGEIPSSFLYSSSIGEAST